MADLSEEKGHIRLTSYDKTHDGSSATPSNLSDVVEVSPSTSLPASGFKRFNERIENLAGFESRGITRVPPEERQPPSWSADLQVMLLWLSANVTINNLAVGLFGPLVFGLGFVDSAMMAVFGAFVGACSTAYMSVWGAPSGNRTMVVLRFFMGYWPAKLPTVLNIILMGGYCTIDCIIGGQVLSAVSGGSMSIAVGIVVVAIVGWTVTVFGMAIFHKYERYAWLPQIIVLFVLIGSAGPHFDASAKSTVTGPALAAARLSFFSMCLYVPNSWGAAASDFYVYYPERTAKVKTFFLTLTGLWVSFSLVYLIAVGLATGIPSVPAWNAANSISTGALIAEGYAPLKGFGKLCSVIVALGVIANCVPGTYSAALCCQVLGRYPKRVPRYVWSTIIAIVEMVLALAGRQVLFGIFSNFLALMGYWVMLMISIVGVEHVWFWRKKSPDWSRWEDKSYLPIGYAAFASFLLGWVGAILGMSQVWYVGPLAKISDGADVGMWVGCGFCLVSYIPLRYVEHKMIGR